MPSSVSGHGGGPDGEKLRVLLRQGVEEGVYPGAVLQVAHRDRVVFFDAVGLRVKEAGKLPMERETVFDLASLTKPLATSLAVMRLVDQGKMDLDQPLGTLLPGESLRDKAPLTPRQLLCHASGLPAWKPFYLQLVHFPPEWRKTLLREQIAGLPFDGRPGLRSLYSDLGFMLLEWVVERQGGEALPGYLERNFCGPLGLERMFLGPSNRPVRVRKEEVAATEICPWRRRLIWGEVHDENAHVLGGHSGHAGLFGTAPDVLALAAMLMAHAKGRRDDFFRPETVQRFFTRQDVAEGGTWALGWDTPSSENSSSGSSFSRGSLGHLGFTGTSLWMDPEKEVIVVFLTNRIHPTRKNEKIRQFRPRLHDAVMHWLGEA